MLIKERQANILHQNMLPNMVQDKNVYNDTVHGELHELAEARAHFYTRKTVVYQQGNCLVGDRMLVNTRGGTFIIKIVKVLSQMLYGPCAAKFYLQQPVLPGGHLRIDAFIIEPSPGKQPLVLSGK